jgi:hypothetical protein
MAPGRVRDERKEQRWRRWIAQWQTSGLTIPAFCARYGLSTANFYTWRRTLRRRDDAAQRFIPVQLVADTAPASPLELLLAGGHAVRVAPGFDAATLRQLLAVLREERPC